MINESNIREFIGQTRVDNRGIFVKIIDVIDSTNEQTVVYESGRQEVIPLTRRDPLWKFLESYHTYY